MSMNRFSDQDVLVVESALQALRNKGAEFWVENGVLRYRVPKGYVTPDDIKVLCRADQRILSSLLSTGRARPQPRLLKRPDPVRAPLGFTQLGHWKGQAVGKYRPVRQVATASRLRGKLDVGALNEAYSVVFTRHEALRTRIVVLDGAPVQEIAPRVTCDLQIRDLTSTSPCERKSMIQREIGCAVLDVADYAVDPLCIGVLLSLGAEENVLLLAMDHIVSDGASVALVLEEILTVYAQLVTSSHVLLPAIGMQLADYAFWQRSELAGWLESCSPKWSAWRRIGFPEGPRVGDAGGWGAVRFTIDARMKCKLQDWARHRRTSLVMAVLTGYVALVLRYCETSEAIIQFITDGRISPLLEHTIGDITFPLYLRILSDPHMTFVSLLERVTHEYCQACEEPEFAYGFVLEPLPVWVRNTHFNWIPERGDLEYSRPAESTTLACSQVEFEHPALDTLDWDGEPSVTFWEAGSEVLAEVSFPRERFSYPAMSQFAEAFQSVLRTLLALPHSWIRDIAVKDA
jgi:hypothetical protein